LKETIFFMLRASYQPQQTVKASHVIIKNEQTDRLMHCKLTWISSIPTVSEMPLQYQSGH